MEDGNTIRVFRDPWLSRGSTFKPLSPAGSNVDLMANDIMVDGALNEEKLHDIFLQDDISLIKQIPNQQMGSK